MPLNNSGNNSGVSIIIVSFNSKNFIIKCLESIFSNVKNVQYEIIIVDNASIDNTIGEVENKFNNVLLIKNSKNVGFAKANNQAIKIARYKYILLLNPDVELKEDVIGLCYDFMERNENIMVWCCGASIFNEHNQPSKSYGYYSSVKKIFFEQFGLDRIFKKYFNKKFEIDFYDFGNLPIEVPFIIGADMFIRKEILNKIGLFDEDFDLNFEETELSYRASRLGYKSMLLPYVKITHLGSQSFKNNEQQWFYYRKNEILFAKKCFSLFNYSLIYIIYIIGTLLRVLLGFDDYDLLLLKHILNFGKKLNK